MKCILLSEIRNAVTFARGAKIRELQRLKKTYGGDDWKKRKGIALVKQGNIIANAEVHWYECQGIGKVEIKIKEFLT